MPAGSRTRLGVCLALVAALALVYGSVSPRAFLNYDDDLIITDVAPLEEGLSVNTLRWAFTTPVSANWFPLTLTSYLVDAELHGLSAAGVHRTNLILHMLSSVLLFLALVRMTGGLWRSAFVAALFALHPLHVETVAWAAERKGTLSGTFWMLTLFVYAGARGGPVGRLRLTGVAAVLALGLMAKGVLLTLPCALLLLDVWPLRRMEAAGAWRRPLLEKIPLFAVVAAASGVTFWAQRSGGTVVGLDVLPLGQRLGNAIVSYVAYLGDYFVPRGLAVFYPHPAPDLPLVHVAAAAVVLALLSAVGLWQRRARPYLLVGWLWYLGTLVPMIGLVQLGSAARADRYSYIPMLGISLALTWLVAEAVARRAHTRPGSAGVLRGAVAVGAIAVLVALSVTTHRQVRHWRDSESLFRHALAATERNHIAHTYLGLALLEQGRAGDALPHLREGVRLRPDYLEAVNNLAWVLATHPDPALRDPEEAVRLARTASRQTAGRDPRVLDTLAAAYAAEGRYDRAVWFAGRALRLATVYDQIAVAADIRARLALYVDEKPYRKPIQAFEGGESEKRP